MTDWPRPGILRAFRRLLHKPGDQAGRNRRSKRAPRGTRSLTAMLAPCALTISTTIAKPSPAPLVRTPLPRQKRSKMTIELAALFFVASCLAVGGLIYSASLTAGSVADRELGLRAEDLARYVSPDETGTPPLELPTTLKQAYSTAGHHSVFALRD